MIKKIKDVMVNTPKGMRHHAELMDDSEGIFLRRTVSYEKDRMRIFNAYSIHPDVYDRLIRFPTVKYIEFIETHGKKRPNMLRLYCEDLFKMRDGVILNEHGNKLVWEAGFAGGKTIYIKVEAFNDVYKQYLLQPKLF